MAQQVKLSHPVSRRLGDLLVADGLLTPEQLQKALAEQKGSTDKLGSILIRLGFINEEQLIGFLSRQYGVPSITLSQLVVDTEVLKLVPPAIAKKYEVLPVRRMGNSLALAMADPTNVFALDDISFMTNLQVLPLVASQSAIKKAIDRHYESKTEAIASVMQDMSTDLSNVEVVEGDEDGAKVDVFELKESADEAPVVKLVNMVLVDAIQKGASDIHFESYEKVFR
ncbi:MAG TPA: type II secretion system protein GspE, partial [Methylomirabilota bacterium]|nr:type II secretion system protein GspE [Methylomirabilota bacterium]